MKFKSKKINFNYIKAIKYAESIKEYRTHYIDEDSKNVVFEFDQGNDESQCFVYNILENKWEKSSFITDEDFDQIEFELANRSFRSKRSHNLELKTITIECSSIIHGLAQYIGYMLDYWTLPNNMKLLIRETKNWKNDFNKFEVWKKNLFQLKVFKKSIKYKRWTEEGDRIFKKAKRMSKSSEKIILKKDI